MAEKRYVEANALREDAMKRAGVSEFEFYNCYPYWQFSKSIDEAPTANVVEVVRCKDCIHYGEEGDCEVHPYDGSMSTNCYCADGERKEKPDGNVKAELSCNVEVCPSYRSGKCNGDKCIYRNDIKAYCLDEKIRGEVQQQRMDGEQ